jgi:hypothetical protein
MNSKKEITDEQIVEASKQIFSKNKNIERSEVSATFSRKATSFYPLLYSAIYGISYSNDNSYSDAVSLCRQVQSKQSLVDTLTNLVTEDYDSVFESDDEVKQDVFLVSEQTKCTDLSILKKYSGKEV